MLNPHAYPVALALGAAAFAPTATLAASASAPPLAAAPVAGQPVSGTVRDAAGQPMPGVTVVLKGTSIGTATNAKGVFTLDAPAGKPVVLIVSYVGYASQEVAYAGQNDLAITLKEMPQGLNDVVVIGYGTAKRDNLTTAVASLPNAEKQASRPITNVQDMLQGNLAGVTVQQNSGDPTAMASVVIRGAGSVNAEAPLYVVDGMPYYGGPLNPNDIASITVLKDAAAAAIYGAQAASGVIVVTTKSGKSACRVSPSTPTRAGKPPTADPPPSTPPSRPPPTTRPPTTPAWAAPPPMMPPKTPGAR